MGIKILIDDFGTGFASVSYLKRLPIDMLKIDKSFVHGSSQNDDDTAIITAIITIAHQLKLKVVGEGIENEAQFALLKAHKCDYVQGDWFSRPLSSDDFSLFLANRSSHGRIPLPERLRQS
jgi:EAL domain-containing protein (putative c-di-GMP-specific phosphodiesterase class I)